MSNLNNEKAKVNTNSPVSWGELSNLLNIISSIEDGGNSAILLSSSPLNLNPTISCDYVLDGGSPAFQAGMVVTDSNGNTGNVLTPAMTLTAMTPSTPPTPATFTGSLTGVGRTTATVTPSTQTMALTFTKGIASPNAVIGNTVTDSLGSSGVIQATNGTTTMTLDSLNMVASSGFTGAITFGSSGTGTAGANVLTMPYAAATGTFYPTFSVGDLASCSGTVVSVSPTTLTVDTLTFSGTNPSFSGLVSSSITATGTVVSFSWGDQAITLPLGSSIMDVWLGLCPTTPLTADDYEIWTLPNRTGIQLFGSNNNYTPIQKLTTPENFINTTPDLLIGFQFIVPTQLTSSTSMITTPATVYATLGTVEGVDLSLTQNIYGYSN